MSVFKFIFRTDINCNVIYAKRYLFQFHLPHPLPLEHRFLMEKHPTAEEITEHFELSGFIPKLKSSSASPQKKKKFSLVHRRRFIRI